MWASVQCLFFLRPRSQRLHVWVCFCLRMYISHLFFWIVKQEGRAGPCLIVTFLPQCLFSFQKFVSLELLGELAKHVLHPVPMLRSALLWERKDAATPLELTDGACGLFCYLQCKPKKRSLCRISDKDTPLFLGIYGNLHWLFFVALNQTKVLIKQRSSANHKTRISLIKALWENSFILPYWSLI